MVILINNGNKYSTRIDFIFEGNLNNIAQELAGHDITDILIEEPSLEEVFMQKLVKICVFY